MYCHVWILSQQILDNNQSIIIKHHHFLREKKQHLKAGLTDKEHTPLTLQI